MAIKMIVLPFIIALRIWCGLIWRGRAGSGYMERVKSTLYREFTHMVYYIWNLWQISSA